MPDINKFDHLEIWFVTGSQDLYGTEALKKVDDHAQVVVDALNATGTLPHKVVFKPVLKSSEEITQFAIDANSAPNCIGIITWMHTFSPAKMWIEGLGILRKPLADLHTQFNRDIPWESIDMDFMNLNQTAHGGREFGHIGARLRLPRKAVVGHWQDPEVHERLAAWTRAARGWHASRSLKLARIGDNMRYVSVTDGDKVSAQIRFGWEVNTYGIGDLVAKINAATAAQVDALCALYEEKYRVAPELKKGAARHQSLRDSAAIEIGLRVLLEEGGFTAFTTTFEDLHGMKQLPGFAVQRLMEDGYGFAGEGDWKTAALTRVMKVMAHGLEGGTSFMEDYTYHLDPANPLILGSHMLEICPSIASEVPKIEIHALGIGGKEDPCRMVFDCGPGKAVNGSIIDLGSRHRFLVNEVECVAPQNELPKLPVARVLWKPLPDLKTATAAWIYAGGAHHTVLSYALTSEHLEDFSEIAKIELSVIDADTKLRSYKNELRQQDLYFHLAQGIQGMNYLSIKEECLAANLALPKTGLVDLTFGNVSVADPERRVFAIKPSGVDYEKLTANDMVIVDYEGDIVEGSYRPSSDTPTHRCLFLNFPGIRSVVHTHSRSAVAFAQAGMDLPCLGTTHCDYFNGPIPVTRTMTPEEVGGEYEWETGRVIVERFQGINPIDLPAVLVRNHGPFAWGPSAAKAVETALALEIVADMALKTLSLNPTAAPAPAHLLEKHFFRKHGANAYYGQSK